MTIPFMSSRPIVYYRNDIAEVKDIIQVPDGKPLGLAMALASCNALNCVYLLSRRHGCQVSVSRITRDDDHQFHISSIISDLHLPNPTLSVASNGDLINISRGGLHRDKCVRCDWFLAT